LEDGTVRKLRKFKNPVEKKLNVFILLKKIKYFYCAYL
jgi:hypothetical protein